MTAFRRRLGFLDGFVFFFGGGGNSCNPMLTGFISDILNGGGHTAETTSVIRHRNQLCTVGHGVKTRAPCPSYTFRGHLSPSRPVNREQAPTTQF